MDVGEDIQQAVLQLALISYDEAKRFAKQKAMETIIPPPPRITSLPSISTKRELWSATYTALAPQDAVGLVMIIKAVARFSHIENLNRQDPWSCEKVEAVVDGEVWTASIRSINSGLRATRESFGTAVESMAHNIDPTVLQGLWSTTGAVEAAVICLLSPAEELHDPIIILTQQSFDEVDDRSDCFRALLRRYPAAAMDGLKEFLRTFIQTATFTPESCSLAKWLVRCFTDVLDALCRRMGNSDALLQSNDFLSTYSDGPMTKRISDLWHLMTTALALIFKRTSVWAPYYDNETMIDWMRDALIFGRQMTEYIRMFEAAVLGHSGSRFGDVAESPMKKTSTGRRLVQQLELVLTDLVSWLRITEWVLS